MKKRLTIEVIGRESYATVMLDGVPTRIGFHGDSQEEVRAAAQQYIDELLAHFRAGGE